MNRLYRSRQDRMLAGVCGGLGEYFDIDSSLVRLGLVLLIVFGGTGFLAYIIAWIIIPEAPAGYEDYKEKRESDPKPRPRRDERAEDVVVEAKDEINEEVKEDTHTEENDQANETAYEAQEKDR